MRLAIPPCNDCAFRRASTHMFGTRLLRRCSVLIITAVVVALPSPAAADQYIVDFCKNWVTDAPGTLFAGVTGFGASGEVADCHRGTASGGVHQLHAGARMSYDTVAGIQLTVPRDRPGVTIDRVLTAHALAASGGSAAFLRFMAEGVLLDNRVGPQSRRDDRALQAGVRSLEWSVYCSYSAGPTPCQWASSDDVLHVYKVRLFLTESASPSVVTTGGSLLGRGARKGVRTVVFDAEDIDSGLQEVTVKLGGVVAGRLGYACAAADWSACQRSRRAQTMGVDTTSVPDGWHDVTITATDAAQNSAVWELGEIEIRNGSDEPTTPPPAVVTSPGGEVASEVVARPNGSPASRVARLRVRHSASRGGRGTAKIPYASSLMIHGRLTDAASRPIADAVVDILSRHSRAGARRAQIGAVRTDRGGEFSYRLSAGPSRTVTFAYTAFAGEPRSAQSSVITSVPASIVAARFVPRSPRPGQRVAFIGRLGHLPRAGVQINIQFLDGRRWRTIGLTRTRAEGRFTWYYRFTLASPGDQFVLRAHVSSPIYPFAAGNSRAVIVPIAG